MLLKLHRTLDDPDLAHGDRVDFCDDIDLRNREDANYAVADVIVAVVSACVSRPQDD